MSAILCCWEIGAGFGHLFRLYPLVKELQKNAHEVSVISRDLSKAKAIFEPLGIIVNQTPANPAPYKKFPLSLNYAQNLLRNGFWHKPSLQSQLCRWLELYDKFQPDLILAEHAPAALLAARLAGVRSAAVGTGFTIPPSVSPMPTIQPWFTVPQSRLIQIEKEFLTLVNPILEELGGSPLTSAADIFKGVETFLCTFPELDHYGKRIRKPYCGPIVYSPLHRNPEWPIESGKKVFVYLRATNRYLQPLIQHLQQTSLSVLACVPDLPETELDTLQRPNIRITTEPVDLRQVARDCRLMINQGGTNSGTLMLLCGVPLMMLPAALEQTMWAYRITAQGMGNMVNPFKPEPDLKAKIKSSKNFTEFDENIQSFRQRHTNYDSQKTIREIANRITMM